MDKYEFKLKVDEMKALVSARNYKAAAEIAETINWRKIRNLNAMVLAGEVFEQVGRYEESREILLMAYDKSPIGRNIIYRLAEIAIKTKNFDEAKEYYDEFVDIAPHDNLKYVLKYKMSAAQGLPYKDQIQILEELKEQEYSEEWAYELAYLYHRDGQPDKCVEACDELILWFGDGIYVEKALELKMHYQPLSKQQEDKYRRFRQKRTGVIEVKPDDFLESGEIINETVAIPSVVTNAGKYNTMNLQQELAKGMQQIIDARGQEDVSDAMDNIKKIVEEIPYLSIPEQEEEQAAARQEQEEQALADEIDSQLDENLTKMLAKEQAQADKAVPAQEQAEPPMSIEEILAEWEKTKQATQTVLRKAEKRQLESTKARALQEAEGLMERLMQIVPQLAAGVTPRELLEQEYLQGTGVLEREETEQMQDNIAQAGRIVSDINELMQQQIDTLAAAQGRTQRTGAPEPRAEETQPEEAQREPERPYKEPEEAQREPERLYKEPEPEEARREPERPYKELEEAERLYEEPQPESVQRMRETPRRMADPTQEMPDISGKGQTPEEEPALNLDQLGRQLERAAEEETAGQYQTSGPYTKPQEEDRAPQPYTEPAEEERSMQPYIETEEEEFSEEDMEAAAEAAGFYKDRPQQDMQYNPQQNLQQGQDMRQPVSEKRLTPEQKQIFSYFVPIAGMEAQIYDLLAGVAQHLQRDKNATSGNIVVEGISGSGKTVLIMDIIKVLQKELKRPNGKIGKIDATALNKKDMRVLTEKVSGGCLIVETAGKISRETAVKLSECMEKDRAGTLFILEDTSQGIQKALERDSSFAAKFTEKITIPLFTSDELVAFGKAYANDLDYDIDEMGILALYKRISSIQKLDHVTTLTEVKEIIDEAIDNAEKGALKKVFGILTSTRYNDENFVVLREKDFEG